MPTDAPFPFALEHIFSYTADLDKTPEVIGQTPEGILVNFYVTGGQVTGPKVTGQLSHVGGDWYTLRPDGVGISDVRATMQTADGALIYMAYTGVMDLGEDGCEKFVKQQLPDLIPLRVTPRYHTAHPNYQWLNRLQCIGIGQVDNSQSTVSYDVYAIH